MRIPEISWVLDADWWIVGIPVVFWAAIADSTYSCLLADRKLQIGNFAYPPNQSVEAKILDCTQWHRSLTVDFGIACIDIE